ncbi:MAG: TIGR02757 family protein [Microbacter sp.]
MSSMQQQNHLQQLKQFLDKRVDQYNRPEFIEQDPIQIPHRFRNKEDIEIAALLTSTIAWGNRNMIIQNAQRLMMLLENDPYRFVMHASENELKAFSRFAHRTFNGEDGQYFIASLRNLYSSYQGLEEVFAQGYAKEQCIAGAIDYFRQQFLTMPHPKHVEKHIANIRQHSGGKRLNLFLRWMIRKDDRQVDFGLWDRIPMSALMLPLDIHSGKAARKFGLLQRKQNDWQAVEEVTAQLRTFDPNDPVKYDFALFAVDLFEKEL